MASLPIGFITTFLMVVLSMEADAWPLFLNKHAIIIVLMGTITILVFSTPTSGLVNLMRSFLKMFKREERLDDYLGEFKELSQHQELRGKSRNELINYANELWQQGIEKELFIVLISQRRAELEEGESDAIASLRNLAKYPPALGMTGTVIGLISLFSNLGSDSKDHLGPALALAMTATFFGLIVAHGLVMPLADRLSVIQLQRKSLLTSVYQILVLINRGEADSLIEDEVVNRAAA